MNRIGLEWALPPLILHEMRYQDERTGTDIGVCCRQRHCPIHLPGDFAPRVDDQPSPTSCK
jgi:hypothetical protein